MLTPNGGKWIFLFIGLLGLFFGNQLILKANADWNAETVIGFLVAFSGLLAALFGMIYYGNRQSS